jgi:hypothetical protein
MQLTINCYCRGTCNKKYHIFNMNYTKVTHEYDDNNSLIPFRTKYSGGNVPKLVSEIFDCMKLTKSSYPSICKLSDESYYVAGYEL